MQSLPTALNSAQLDAILNTLAGLPSAKVSRQPNVITVTATRKATGESVKVFSAITGDGKRWHVMAVPGLISTTFTH